MKKRIENISLLIAEVIKKLKGADHQEVTQNDVEHLRKQLITAFPKQNAPSPATIRRFLRLDKSYPIEQFSDRTLDKFARYIAKKNFNDFQKWVAHLSPLSPNHPLAKYYAPPFSRMALALAFRLKEIFEGRNAFLKDNQQNHFFNQYRYISTLYRLSAILGWLTIMEKERFDFEPIKEYLIKDLIFKFRDCLANGRSMEIQIVKDLCDLWKLPITEKDEAAIIKAGILIDQLIFTVTAPYFDQKKSIYPTVKDLKQEEQQAFLQQIIQILKETIFKNRPEVITDDWIENQQTTAINQIGRTQYWIFFDWQTGIGDMMREQIATTTPKFDVIGFGTFETYFEDPTIPVHRWIKRLEPLFKGFNYQVELQKTDARMEQLTHLFYVLIDLIELFTTRGDQEYIKKESALSQLKAFKQCLEKDFPIPKRK